MKAVFKKYWYLFLIGVLILGFAVVIYALITPSPPEYTVNTVAGLIFDFLDKWASAGAPAMTLLAVAVALYLGIKSRRQTENIQERERRDRHLDEIIVWATEIIEWDIDASFEAKKELKEANEPSLVILMQLFRFSGGFREAKRRGKLTIRPLTLKFKGESLTKAIDKVLEALQRQLELLGLQEMAIMGNTTSKTPTLSNEFNLAQ